MIDFFVMLYFCLFKPGPLWVWGPWSVANFTWIQSYWSPPPLKWFDQKTGKLGPRAGLKPDQSLTPPSVPVRLTEEEGGGCGWRLVRVWEEVCVIFSSTSVWTTTERERCWSIFCCCPLPSAAAAALLTVRKLLQLLFN